MLLGGCTEHAHLAGATPTMGRTFAPALLLMGLLYSVQGLPVLRPPYDVLLGSGSEAVRSGSPACRPWPLPARL